MTFRAGLCIFLISMLTACAGIAPSSTHIPNQTSAYRDSINIDGRMSVQYEQNGASESLHGNFSWSQTPKRTVVTLSSPLGQTLAVIEVTPELSILKENGQSPRMASDPDSLTELALGWPLPVAGMRDWLQGVATDGSGMRFVASPQSEKSEAVTTRDGWHIRYVSWQESENSPATAHPKRIDLARNTQQAGDVSIRLVIDNWQPQ